MQTVRLHRGFKPLVNMQHWVSVLPFCTSDSDVSPGLYTGQTLTSKLLSSGGSGEGACPFSSAQLLNPEERGLIISRPGGRFSKSRECQRMAQASGQSHAAYLCIYLFILSALPSIFFQQFLCGDEVHCNITQ